MPLPALKDWTDAVGTGIDIAGVSMIVIGTIIATFRFLRDWHGGTDIYRRYRQEIGRSILLGLELLVAGDIIRTVVVAPTMRDVLVLGMIILIRTFLSISLQVELEGRWPWQKKSEP